MMKMFAMYLLAYLMLATNVYASDENPMPTDLLISTDVESADAVACADDSCTVGGGTCTTVAGGACATGSCVVGSGTCAVGSCTNESSFRSSRRSERRYSARVAMPRFRLFGGRMRSGSCSSGSCQ